MTTHTGLSEPLACPFCGETPILNHIEPHTHHLTFNGQPLMPDHQGSWTIECCDVGMIKETREEVVAAWNRRTPALAATDRNKREGAASPQEMTMTYAEHEQFIQAAIDRAPEPLRRLGEYLSQVLDEDDWKTAERLLLGAASSCAS